MEEIKTPAEWDLKQLLERRQTAAESIKRMEAVKAECDLQLGAVLDLNETEKILLDDFTFFRRKGSEPRKTISPEKLLAAGVPARVIQECTTIGEKGKPSIVVKRVDHED